MWPFALTWDAKSYSADQRMAQTRRMGKRNQRADLPKAPRFSPYQTMFPSLRDLLLRSSN
jgi:hypothetical protein